MLRRSPVLQAVLLTATAICLAVCAGDGRAQAPAPQTPFATQIAALSEPGGFFDTDNLISNEGSYLTALQDLQRAGLKGGAYIGVGPDQNFSYIAQLRPAIAFIIDIRRDNMLLHLLFKALFAASRTRVEYLALLCGRPAPKDLGAWRDKSIDQIVQYVDSAQAGAAGGPLMARRNDTIRSFGVSLSPDDFERIEKFHRRFIASGLDLRFQSTGRAPQSYYPTLRQLLLATDASGRQSNFLASEESFQFVKSLQARDLVIPVVGDLSGPAAMQAIGRHLRQRNERLSVFYASNVEFYLYREGTIDRFIENLAQFPRAEGALIIRSIFGRGGFGGGSVSVTQPIAELVAAGGRRGDPAPRR